MKSQAEVVQVKANVGQVETKGKVNGGTYTFWGCWENKTMGISNQFVNM
jgi:hypothetical protein